MGEPARTRPRSRRRLRRRWLGDGAPVVASGVRPGYACCTQTGCSAACLARLTGGQKVGGSNPLTPTFREIKPFDILVEGLSRYRAKSCALPAAVPPPVVDHKESHRFRLAFGRELNCQQPTPLHPVTGPTSELLNVNTIVATQLLHRARGGGQPGALLPAISNRVKWL